jgi:hypothetical protein
MKRSLLVLAILATGCMPGNLREDLCPCGPGTHCVRNACVRESDPDAGPPPPGDGPCHELGFDSIDQVESRFIAPRCGMSMCHGPGGGFPPRNLHQVDQIRAALVGQKPTLYCKGDFYVNRSAPEKSYLLAKIEAEGPMVTCPSGGQGGTRMPNANGKPTMPGDRLTDGEIACLRWWVSAIAKE